MRSILSLLLIVLAHGFLSAETKAQTAAPPSCPVVRIESKAHNPFQPIGRDVVCPGANVTFTAVLDGISPEDKATFNWKVSGGKIISGHGTSTITVSTEEPNNGEITAAVEVGGLNQLKSGCNVQAAKTLGIALNCQLPCPSISISCPTDIPKPGEAMAVVVNVFGGGVENLNLKYSWQVSAGKIISGQGTPQISVDTSETAGRSVTATVEIDGLPPECDRMESCSFSFSDSNPVIEARKLDEYGKVSWSDEEKRLSNFGILLEQDPGAQGHVIVYGLSGNITPYLARIRKFLVEKRGIEPSRLLVMNGGSNERARVELWIVPTGAAPPTLK